MIKCVVIITERGDGKNVDANIEVDRMEATSLEFEVLKSTVPLVLKLNKELEEEA